jgi:ABC-type antimicrobial peptide transport system permease subunit
MQTISAVRDRAVSAERTIAQLSGALAVVATLLAGIGLYGLLTFSVTSRTREIGLRLALGAECHDVVRLVATQALFHVGLGLAIGLPASLALGRYLGSQLFGLPPHDPYVVASAVVVVGITALAAAYVPAFRASLVDPTRALRHE